ADEPYSVLAAQLGVDRALGKTCDLAFGYQGGLGAFRKFLPDRFSDEEVEQLKKRWRAQHPRVRQFWRDIDFAALRAVKERGRIIRCGRIAFKTIGAHLLLKLPNGRKISYPHARIIGNEREQSVVFNDNAAGQFTACRHGQGAYGGLWTENIVQAVAR